MVFASWTWTWVLGALAFASTFVVVIHLLRLRRRRREVAFLPIFEEALGDASAAKRIDWIRRLLALLLGLAIVGALSLALGDPRFARGDEDRAVVVLVDHSLSMDTVHEGRSRLDLAKEAARRIVRELGSGDLAAIVAVGDTPVPMTSLTNEVESLDRAIDAIPSSTGGADLDAAVALAADIVAERTGAEIVVVGDGPYETPRPPEGVKVFGVRVGRPAENLAIEAFATRRVPLDPSRASVLLRVANHGSRARRARVELWSSAALIESHDVSLDPGEVRTLSIDDVPVHEERVEARLVPSDDVDEGLAADDIAHAAISPRRHVRVHVVTPGNLFLEAALLLDPTVAITDSAPGEPLPSTPPDLYVFDRALPEAKVRAPSLFIAPPSSPEGVLPVRLGETIEAPYFEHVKKEDPLVAGLRFVDVNIKQARSLRLEEGDTVLGRFGRDALLARGVRDEVPFVVMGFAVEESDLPLRVSWPLFLLRVIDDLTRRDVHHSPSHRAGRPVEIALATRASTADWTRPSGETSEVTLEAGSARIVPLEPGVHTLETDDARNRLVVQRSSARESRLAVPETLSLGGEPLETPPERSSARSPRPLLVLLALAALLLSMEHLLFHRRWIE